MLLADQAQPAAHAHPAIDAAPVPSSPVDYDLLQGVIEALEEIVEEKGLTLEPARKAACIQLMYKYCVLGVEGNPRKTVEEFLRLVA